MKEQRWPPTGTVLGDDGAGGCLAGGEERPCDWDVDLDSDAGDFTDADGLDLGGVRDPRERSRSQ